MKLILILTFSLTSLSILSQEKMPSIIRPEKWISIEHTVLSKIKAKSKTPIFNFKEVIKTENKNYYLVNDEQIDSLANHLHHLLNRCGGFQVLSKKPQVPLISSSKNKAIPDVTFSEFWPNEMDKLINLDYSIKSDNLVLEMFEKTSTEHVDTVINHLSNYHTRYYKSDEGVEALNWIGQKWTELTSFRNDVKVEYYRYKNHDQPTVILTIEGSDPELKDQYIILGGHGDSINADDPTAHLRAPGANDNAAGIGVLTDIIKVLMDQNYKPRHSIQIIAYAAEEVGLQGSAELAEVYRQNKKKVIGVLQFDGINYTGKTYDMALISDLTHGEQNIFLAKLVDHYLKINWTWDKCEYACSDHYSWHSQGYRASFPVEAIMSEQDPYIHTSQDTFDKSGNNSQHAMMFEKLGIAYLVELDN